MVSTLPLCNYRNKGMLRCIVVCSAESALAIQSKGLCRLCSVVTCSSVRVVSHYWSPPSSSRVSSSRLQHLPRKWPLLFSISNIGPARNSLSISPRTTLALVSALMHPMLSRSCYNSQLSLLSFVLALSRYSLAASVFTNKRSHVFCSRVRVRVLASHTRGQSSSLARHTQARNVYSRVRAY